MCGICGAIWTDASRAIDAETLRRMTDVMTHRGPDDSGQHLAQGVALGHRRLSIIDLAGGQQPMCNEDGTVWIVYNGEVYNFLELRPDLEARGHHFKTNSDTEVILHLYEDEGAGCLERLRGMFALAIWDAPRRRLFLARDRLGQKPLVYREEAGRLLFASEQKSLLQVPGVPRELDPQALDAYLALQYVPHPQSIFKGFRKLPPAHYAVYENGRLTVEPYWRPDFSRESTARPEELAERLRHVLDEATRLRMISDVPLGAFLSGGIDSTVTVGLMQRHSTEPVKTFSIGFDEASYDETHYARLAAEHFGTDHHEFTVKPDCMAILPELVWHYDEPFADSSAIPTYYVSKLTRQHVTVALTGDAGDECFAGYPRYKAVKLAGLYDKLPWPLQQVIASPMWQSLPARVEQKSKRRRLKKLLWALAEEPQRRYFRWIAIFDDESRRRLYTPDLAERVAEHDPVDFLLDAYAAFPRRDFVSQTTYVDLMTYLPCDLLVKVDIASMTHSLEARSPFLDHKLVELAARIPARYKLRRLRDKHILKEAFSDLIPPAIASRGKMGFGVPIANWFRDASGDFLRDVLLDRRTLQRGYFRPKAVRTYLDDHVAGRWDHGYRLWALVMFEMWHRRFLDEVPTA